MVDHDDKPMPLEFQTGVRAAVMNEDEIKKCTRLEGGDCMAYVRRMGGFGLRTQYQCAAEGCGRPDG